MERVQWWAAPTSSSFLLMPAHPMVRWAPPGPGAVLLLLPTDRSVASTMGVGHEEEEDVMMLMKMMIMIHCRCHGCAHCV